MDDERRRRYDAHRRTQTDYRERKKLYDSARWQRVRATYLAEHPLCERCRLLGRLIAATEVHHRTDLAAGGAPFDWGNLEALCHSCHSSETAGAALKGTTADGVPLARLYPAKGDA